MRIGFYGATGSYDFGDFAMMCENLVKLGAASGDASFVVFTPDVEVTNDCLARNIHDEGLRKKTDIVKDDLFGIDSSPFRWLVRRLLCRFPGERDRFYDWTWNRAKRFYDGTVMESPALQALESCDVLVFNGGGYIQNGWAGKVKLFLAFILAAKRVGVSVWFLGNSFGPLDDDLLGCARIALPKVDGIIVRDGDHRSAALLERIGCRNFTIGTDDLMYALSPQQESGSVAIEFMMWIERHPNGGDWVVGEFSRFTQWLLELGYSVDLVCFDKEDEVAVSGMNQIIRDCGGSPLVRRVEDPLDARQVYSSYERCTFSVSCKYHPVIFSLSCSRPCLSFICDSDGYYADKLNGAFESVGLDPSGRVLPLEELSFETLRTAFLNRDTQMLDSPLKRELAGKKDHYIAQMVNYCRV